MLSPPLVLLPTPLRALPLPPLLLVVLPLLPLLPLLPPLLPPPLLLPLLLSRALPLLPPPSLRPLAPLLRSLLQLQLQALRLPPLHLLPRQLVLP